MDYEQLTEGPGDNTHFIILKAPVCGKLVGYALYIYDRHPAIGRNKVKITYTYGYNIDTKILQEYATKKVSVQVLEVWAASTAKAIDLKTGPWAPLYSSLKERIKELDDWLPRRGILEVG